MASMPVFDMELVERLRTAESTERLRRDLIGAIENGFDLDGLRSLADQLTELADAIENSLDALNSWADEEDREAKADYRQEALGYIAELVEAVDGLESL